MIRLTDQEFEEITEYVKKRFGIDLEKKRILIECRLAGELERHHLSNFHSYFNFVRQDLLGKHEDEMMNRLTTNYTFFLREFSHFEYLQNIVIPQLQLKKFIGPFKIWSAGCSTGQECYTLCMVLEDLKRKGYWVPEYKIYATDLSQEALAKAVRGRYLLKELEKIPLDWQEKYCSISKQEGYFDIKTWIREKVMFRKSNLLEQKELFEKYDLIICRNVMIYFDDRARDILLKNFYYSLKKGGYLFIGHTELIQGRQNMFEYICPAVYRKNV